MGGGREGGREEGRKGGREEGGRKEGREGGSRKEAGNLRSTGICIHALVNVNLNIKVAKCTRNYTQQHYYIAQYERCSHQPLNRVM